MNNFNEFFRTTVLGNRFRELDNEEIDNSLPPEGIELPVKPFNQFVKKPEVPVSVNNFNPNDEVEIQYFPLILDTSGAGVFKLINFNFSVKQFVIYNNSGRNLRISLTPPNVVSGVDNIFTINAARYFVSPYAPFPRLYYHYGSSGTLFAHMWAYSKQVSGHFDNGNA